MRQHQNVQAGPHLDRALQLFREADQTRGRAHILLAQAELFLGDGDLVQARAKADEAGRLADSLGEVASLSEAKQILGMVAAAERDDEAVDRLFAESIALLEQLQLPERLTTVHATYAGLLEKRGAIARALEHWRHAVASTHPEAAIDSSPLTEIPRQAESA
jgi:tetratricopeptide (TPR) repeat protein